MTLKAQGSDIFAIDPADGSLLDVGCVTSITGIDTTIDQIETTCLNNLVRTYEAGLATPGAASFGLMFDPADVNHIRLHQLKTAGTTLQWVVGLSDGTANPTTATDSNGDDEFVLPPTRSWIQFEGYMNSYPFEFALNAMVTSTVGIQVSGEPIIIPKSSS